MRLAHGFPHSCAQAGGVRPPRIPMPSVAPASNNRCGYTLLIMLGPRVPKRRVLVCCRGGDWQVREGDEAQAGAVCVS